MLGVPGLGKTLMAKTIARTLQMDFRRIQFTPDLMPSDIIGTDVIEEDPRPAGASSSSSRARSSPTSCSPTRSTAPRPRRRRPCLQAMQEQEVSVGRRSYAARAAVLRHRHAEPDRAGRDLPAARGPARPVHVQHPGRLPDPRRGGRDRQGIRPPTSQAEVRPVLDAGGDRAAPASSSAACRWPTPWSATP